MGAPQGVGDNIISSDVVVGMTAVVVKWWVWGYFFDMGFSGVELVNWKIFRIFAPSFMLRL